MLVVSFGFLMALSSIFMTDPMLLSRTNYQWNRGAVKCLGILMEGMVDYRRLGDFGDLANLLRIWEI